MERISVDCYGKINLGLDVIDRRTDGYHLVKMVMQAIALKDDLTLQKRTDKAITFNCNRKELPTDERNIAVQGAKLIQEQYNLDAGVDIFLEKRIPIAAGLAGGSANAAGVLKGMNELFALQLSLEELQKIGLKLGADVPFSLLGGTALAEGIGEKLRVLKPMPQCEILLAKPDIAVSTKAVYQAFDLKNLISHPDIDGLVEELEKASLKGVAYKMANVLEAVTISWHPVIQEIKACMKEKGGLISLMSGSGPTVLGIFEEKEKAQAAYEWIQARHLAKEIFLTNPMGGQTSGI